MKLLQNWRIITILFLVLWCAVLIHPFTKTAVEVTSADNPASFMIRSNDFITNINGEKVTSMDSFEEITDSLNPNESVQVTFERETFPYTYRMGVHNYITNTDDNPLAFYVTESSFSKIKFNSQLQESNRFTIETSDMQNTISVLTKRFKTSRVSDFVFKTEGNNVILYTSHGAELKNLIDTNGNFEAKIGNELFFTDKDITKYCISGVDCMVHTYAMLNQTKETKEIVWKYGFETYITEDAGTNFAPLVNDLGISTCEYDRCVLNDTITYYLDGNKIGFDSIYATDKGKNMTMIFIGGDAVTKEDALYNLHFIQAILQGRTDAKVISIEKAAPLMGENAVKMFVIAISAIIAVNAVLLLVIFRDIKTSLVSLALGAAELIIIFGFFAGLRMPMTLLTMSAMVAVPVLSLVYQNYSALWIKKEGLILRKIMELNSRLNKIFWVAAGLALVITMFKSDLAVPLLVYFMLEIIITKGLFFRAIKAKEM